MTTKNQVIKSDSEIILYELENANKMCLELMRTPHYSKIGEAGIFAIVQKAKTLNIDPLDALNGGLYCVQGKVEMSAQMMSQLIRQAGHSLTKDRRSDDTICILHGKRKDNDNTWTESFCINDAKRAGIYKPNSPWTKFPRNMLYARALSNLARQLFSDVIKGCYVKGEILEDDLLNAQVMPVENEPNAGSFITEVQYRELDELIGKDDKYRNDVLRYIKKAFGSNSLKELPAHLYEKVRAKAVDNLEKLNKLLEEVTEQYETVEDEAALS